MSNDVMREHKLREIIAALILEAEETGITQVTRKVAIDAISTPYRIPSSAPAQSEAKVLCETCGGSKVDPGGEGYCRSCKQQRVEPAVVKASGGNAHAKMLMDLQVLEDGTPLYTAPQSAADVRDEALEEVAQEIERTRGRLLSADAIRALKSKKEA